MNLDSVTYSTKPLTLADHILSQRSAKGDYEAMAGYILNRTDMTSEQILALDDEELLIVVTKIGQAVLNSIVIQQISRALDAN